MQQQILRVAIIGSGNMGVSRAEQFLARADCRVTVVASRNEESGRRLAGRCEADWVTDWREALEMSEVDAVCVTTPNHLHGANILESLEAGRAVLAEYPVCRRWEEADRIAEHLRKAGVVLRLTHRELVSPTHQALKAAVAQRGNLLSSNFIRRTPGRGARPDVLFNLRLSGPPALFFVYHIYPVLDLFGRVQSVSAASAYGGFDEKSEGYESFSNSVIAHFAGGGYASWQWAGGVAIDEPMEMQQIFLSDGSLLRENGEWRDGKSGTPLNLPTTETTEGDLIELFVQEALGKKTDDAWREDGLRAVQAARVGLAAEISAREGRIVEIPA